MAWKTGTVIIPGSKFGEWEVLSYAGKDASGRNRIFWCQCSCGTQKQVRGVDLRRDGKSKRCRAPGMHLQDPNVRKAPEDSPPTARQIELLNLAAEGLSNAQIAKKLFVSASTVESHFKNVYPKLKATNRIHAVAIAIRTGLI